VQASRGVVCCWVAGNSGIELTGLQTGDVIEQINGRAVKTADDVKQTVKIALLVTAYQ